MSDIPYRACRVGGRRLRRTERQYPYYRPQNRPLQNESCARRHTEDSRQHQGNEGSRRALNEDAFYSSPSQERSRSRNRGSEMAHSKGHRLLPTWSKVREHKIDQRNLEFEQQRAGSEMAPSVSRNWADMVELEELAAEQQNLEFETEYNRLCPEQVKEELKDIPVQRYTSSHVRQNSLLSNPSSFGSDLTTESKKIKMSATPRFTESELNTKEVQAIIARRKKQIQYGKVLDCYHRYIQVVPRHKRTKYHPRTPDIYRNYSRRGFDTLVRTWKKQLHVWEPTDRCGRSMKLGSTCVSSITTDATEAIKTCKNEIKEDLDDFDYDSEFPPMPTSAACKTEGSSEPPSVESSTTIKAESSDDDDTTICGVVVKTEKPDDFCIDESCN